MASVETFRYERVTAQIHHVFDSVSSEPMGGSPGELSEELVM